MKTSLLGLFLSATAVPAIAQNATVDLNDRGRFTITPATTILVDKEVQPELPASIIGTGFRTAVFLDAAAPPGFINGVATAVVFSNTIKGPITQLSPLQVLAQNVVIDADTVLVGVPADLSTLTVGGLLEVSGFTNANGAIQATRVRARTSLDDWKLEGGITQVTASEIAIGAQRVLIQGVAPGCTLQPGLVVSVSALPVPGYTPGSVINTTTEIECVTDLPPLPGGAIAQVEGFVSSLPVGDEFTIGTRRIRILPATEFERGSRDDLVVGVRVTVVGSIEASTQVLLAAEIDFERTQFRFEAPAAPADLTPGVSIRLYANTAHFSALTRDEDGLAANGLNQPLQVEVRGYVDRGGDLIVTRIRERGDPDPSELELRGPVASVQPPLLTVLGVRIDTSAALLLDVDGSALSAAQFFALLAQGGDISIENGNYNASLNQFSGGLIQIEWRPDSPPTLEAIIGTGAPSAGFGTATAVRGDRIFSNGF